MPHASAKRRPGRKAPTYVPLPVGPLSACGRPAREVLRDGVKDTAAAAAFLCCSTRYVRKLLARKKFTSFKEGSRRLIPVSELVRYLEECQSGTNPNGVRA